MSEGNGKAIRVAAVTDNDWFKLVSRVAMIACAAALRIASFFAKGAWETLNKVAEASVVQTQTLLHHAGRIDDIKADQKTLREKQQMNIRPRHHPRDEAGEGPMNLSAHFTLTEAVKSQTALRLGIDSTLPPEVIPALREAAERILELA